MPILLGKTSIGTLCLGKNRIQGVYLGKNKIWGKISIDLSSITSWEVTTSQTKSVATLKIPSNLLDFFTGDKPIFTITYEDNTCDAGSPAKVASYKVTFDKTTYGESYAYVKRPSADTHYSFNFGEITYIQPVTLSKSELSANPADKDNPTYSCYHDPTKVHFSVAQYQQNPYRCYLTGHVGEIPVYNDTTLGIHTTSSQIVDARIPIGTYLNPLYGYISSLSEGKDCNTHYATVQASSNGSQKGRIISTGRSPVQSLGNITRLVVDKTVSSLRGSGAVFTSSNTIEIYYDGTLRDRLTVSWHSTFEVPANTTLSYYPNSFTGNRSYSLYCQDLDNSLQFKRVDEILPKDFPAPVNNIIDLPMGALADIKDLKCIITPYSTTTGVFFDEASLAHLNANCWLICLGLDKMTAHVQTLTSHVVFLNPRSYNIGKWTDTGTYGHYPPEELLHVPPDNSAMPVGTGFEPHNQLILPPYVYDQLNTYLISLVPSKDYDSLNNNDYIDENDSSETKNYKKWIRGYTDTTNIKRKPLIVNKDTVIKSYYNDAMAEHWGTVKETIEERIVISVQLLYSITEADANAFARQVTAQMKEAGFNFTKKSN